MKKFLLFLAALCYFASANAQLTDIYLDDNVVLSDNQWHFNQYSVIKANGNNYLVITPNSYNMHYLQPFSVSYFESRNFDRVISYNPYIHNGSLGWYIRAVNNNYFYYPNGSVIVLYSTPLYYDVYYSLRALRHLNLRHWYWHHSRPPRYHKPPVHHHHAPPAYNNHRPPRKNDYNRPSNNRPPRNSYDKPSNNRPPRNSYDKPSNNRPPRSKSDRSSRNSSNHKKDRRPSSQR